MDDGCGHHGAALEEQSFFVRGVVDGVHDCCRQLVLLHQADELQERSHPP